MKLIRRSELRPMPWKNGGGTTCEIMAMPDGASLDAFDWRISIANIDASGPFSRFPGIDRSIAVLAGSGMRLSSPESEPVVLGADQPPWSFAGEALIDCQLSGSPTQDFNVMSRRHRVRHRLTRIHITSPLQLSRSAPITGICLGSGFELGLATAAGLQANLGLHDFALLDRLDGDFVTVSAGREASILVVELTPAT